MNAIPNAEPMGAAELLEVQERRDLMTRIERRLARLYDDPRACMDRLKLLMALYEEQLPPPGPLTEAGQRWDQRDNVLITYGDMVQNDGEPPLRVLDRFLRKHLTGVIDTVHILPFCPYSSDDGFSVIDYRKVDPALGGWEDVQRLGESFRLMFDLVLNHCSRLSGWFKQYMAGVAPHRDYFVEAAPGEDLSAVTRPRQSPLLHRVNTRMGERWVWTTFSEDQVDVNFANPDLMLEFIDILLSYVARGARIIRLDAIAYLWKQIGTTCIHLPETHEVVKLFHNVLQLMAPHVVLLTETNVPHKENISYFGHGDEAHMVYNFSLPPLALHALQTGNGKYLSAWAQSLGAPPDGCTYLNFTASHDGVGVRPLEGLVPQEEFDALIAKVRHLGGHVSEKSNPDGSKSPYELNITYFDAMGEHSGEQTQRLSTQEAEAAMERKVQRFLCSQSIAMAMRGVPAAYFHSVVATQNDNVGVREKGYPRAINRHKWDEATLDELLDNEASHHRRVLNAYKHLLSIRSQQPAFHPDGVQHVLDMGDPLFAVERLAPPVLVRVKKRSKQTMMRSPQQIVCINNLTDEPVSVLLLEDYRHAYDELITGEHYDLTEGEVTLQPYQTVWLAREPD